MNQFHIIPFIHVYPRFFYFLVHYRNLKQEQCQIRLNLVIAIAIAQIMFLSGIQATTYKVSINFVSLSSVRSIGKEGPNPNENL